MTQPDRLRASLTVNQDLASQRAGLAALGVERPRLREALAACREGDTLVVTKLDRLASSVPDARDIVDELTNRGVRLNVGGLVHDPNTQHARQGHLS